MENIRGKHSPEVSIIIPCKIFDDYARRAAEHCRIMYPDHELIIVDDERCPGFPAQKRNYAMAIAAGRYFAFLDSDAFPAKGWLETAVYWLKRHEAVCGPGMLPWDAPIRERIADIVYQLLPYSYRVYPQVPRTVAEYPTFNLIVRREAATPFEDFLTGEDTLFCRKIKTGVFYHPEILVYHNRRPVFKKLWKQVGTYGRHRGHLIMAAALALLSSVFVYSANFVRGLFKRP